MAQRFWVSGGSGTWDTTTTNNWSTTSGGASGASVPTATDDVVLDSLSGTGTVTISGTVVCQSFTGTGSTLAVSFNNSNTSHLQIGSAAGGAFIVGSGMSFTGGLSTVANAIQLVSTSNNGGSGWTINTNGVTVASLTFNGVGGQWNLTSALTVSIAGSGALILLAGTVVTAGFSVSTWQFTSSGSATRQLTMSSSTLTILSTSSNALSLGTAVSGLTLSYTTGSIVFTAASGTTTIATSSQSMPNITFNGAGTFTQSDNITSTGTITLSAGTWATAGFAATSAAIVLGNNVARTWTPSTSSITVNGAGNAFTAIATTNLSITANTATLNISPSAASASWNQGNINLNGMSVVINCGAFSTTMTWDGSTINNLTVNGAVARQSILNLNGDVTVTGNVVFNGGSTLPSGNRLRIATNAIGQLHTIAVSGTVSVTNGVDFMDIALTGTGAPFNLSAASCGDAGGNSGITFPTGRTLYVVGNTSTGNQPLSSLGFSLTSGGASGQSQPLAQDNLIVDRNSSTVNFTLNIGDYAWPCKDFDSSDMTNAAFFLTVTNSVGHTTFGNIKLPSANMGYPGGQIPWVLGGRGNFTITSNGTSLGSTGVSFATSTLQLRAPGGTYTLNDNLTLNTSDFGGMQLVSGTFVLAGHTLNVAGMVVAPTSGTITATLDMTNSTINLTTTLTQNLLSVSSNTGFTLINTGGTWNISTASTNTRSFLGNSNSFGNLTYTVGSSPGPLAITGANTFNTINVSGGARVLQLPGGTITTVSKWNVSGAATTGYVYLPGQSGSCLSTPSSSITSITGPIDLRWYGVLDNWGANTQAFLSKWSAGQQAFVWNIPTTGPTFMRFFWSTTGSDTNSLTSSVALSALGFGTTPVWLRCTFDTTTGNCNFYYSAVVTPGVGDWTQIGTQQAFGSATSIFASTSEYEIGSYNSQLVANVSAKIYKTQILNGINGTAVSNLNLTTTTSGTETTYTDSGTSGATWTVNGVANGLVYINSSNIGVQATLTSASSQTSNYVSIKDSRVDASPQWFAIMPSNGASGANNTNWIFAISLSAIMAVVSTLVATPIVIALLPFITLSNSMILTIINLIIHNPYAQETSTVVLQNTNVNINL